MAQTSKRNTPETISAAQKGDEGAFATLYSENYDNVYGIAMKMVKNPDAAEDMAQEVFMQLFKKIHTFRGESQFSTWLHRLAVNVVLMHLRKKTGVTETSLVGRENVNTQSHSGIVHLPSVEDDITNMTPERISLVKALKDLPTGYRLSFVLHDINGFKHKEIAKIMGCSAGNSKSQLHKARLKLRKVLKTRAVSA